MDTKKQQFRVKPIAAAVGLAMVVPFMISSAFAVTQGNLPANGIQVTGTPTYTSVIPTYFGGATNAQTITISGPTVIAWEGSSSATINGAAVSINPSATYGGFNIGAQGTNSDALTFNGSGTVLNVDGSGLPSIISGSLTGVAGVNVFVANANGIVVNNGAVLSAPVLGLLGSNTTQFDAAGNIPVGFSGTTGTITINDGASVTGTTIIAGSGMVKVSASNPGNISSTLTVDGGVGGIVSSTGLFTPGYQDKIGTSNVVMTNAATNVNLAIGTATNPIQAGTIANVYAYGDIVNTGDIAQTGTIQFTGTLSNSGILQSSGVSGNAGTSTSAIATSTTSYAPMGNVVNSGTISAPSGFSLDIAGDFTNTGTLNLGGTGAATLTNSFTEANFNNSGTINLVTTKTGTSGFTVNATQSATLAGTFSAPTLNSFRFNAGTAAGNLASINTSAINVSGTGANVTVTGFNVNLGSNITAGTAVDTGSVTLNVGGNSGISIGTLTIGSSATIMATGPKSTDGTSTVAANGTGHYNVSLNGTLAAGNTITVGGANNIQGAGAFSNMGTLSLTAAGNVNNPNGGGAASNGYLKNGLIVNAPSSGTQVSVDANGNAVQYWNIKVVGDGTFTSGTSNFAAGGVSNSSRLYNYNIPANNAGSHLIMTATGNLVLNGGTGNGVGGQSAFDFPGLIVAVSGKDMAVNGALDNAFGANVPAGNGILLNAGGSLTVNAPIYTNGNSLFNYWAPGGLNLNSVFYNTVLANNTSTGVQSYVPVVSPFKPRNINLITFVGG
ncbi:MAG: hypothetical protein M0003_07690 [Acidithiobacillus sp.]|nr:hypothetical protein [Acidithiobacillus sp.]